MYRQWIGKDLDGCGHCPFETVCLEGLRKTTKYVSQDNLSFERGTSGTTVSNDFTWTLTPASLALGYLTEYRLRLCSREKSQRVKPSKQKQIPFSRPVTCQHSHTCSACTDILLILSPVVMGFDPRFAGEESFCWASYLSLGI